MKVVDLREEKIRKESNAHTLMLEEIVERKKKNRIGNQIGNLSKRVSGLFYLAGSGFFAGYMTSGGDLDTASQFAEYSALLGVLVTIGLEPLLRYVLRRNHKNIEAEIEKEAQEAENLEKNQRFHEYKPKYGLDFANHKGNSDNFLENLVQKDYWQNLETSRKPIANTLKNVSYGAFSFWLVSLLVDIEVNIIDFVALNPIEKGLEITHHALAQIEPLKDYFNNAQHEHLGDFNQLNMAYTGMASGAIQTIREFIRGNYQTIKARMRN